MNRLAAAFLSLSLLITGSAFAQEQKFVLATTTSTENSGLLSDIIPRFTAATGMTIDVVAVGTGQALEMGRRGDAAALLTHDRIGEDKFVAEHYGQDRRDVMYNDFVIIGPANDPARLSDAETVYDALKKIAASSAIFVSRGDDSGTHRKEIRLWAEAGLDQSTFGNWYRESGAGMGNTIITTTEMGGYTITDRATWVKFNKKGDYMIVFDADPPLFNPYSSILVTNDALSADEASYAKAWHEWLTGSEGRTAIVNYKVDGQQLFFISKNDENG